MLYRSRCPLGDVFGEIIPGSCTYRPLQHYGGWRISSGRGIAYVLKQPVLVAQQEQ